MQVVTLLVLLSACVALSSGGRIVCYFISWAIYRAGDGQHEAADVDPTLCTHIIYTSVGLTENATISILDDWEFTSLMEIDHLKALKENNSELEIIVSLGGYGEGSSRFSPIAADPDLRAALVENVVEFLETYEFDGLEVDWQYPGQGNGSDPEDLTNFVILLSDLYDTLSPLNYTLASAASGNYWGIQNSYPDGEAITNVVDFLNIKTIDYHGTWEQVTGHYAPLYRSTNDTDAYANLDDGVQQWLSIGADPAKINLGLGSYGRPFTLLDPEDNGIGAPVNGSGELGPLTNQDGMWGYNEICSVFADYERIWDEEQQVPHKVLGDQWVGYDDEESILVKVEYANEQGLGGVSLYSLDTDDFLGACGNVTYPLLRVINENLL